MIELLKAKTCACGNVYEAVPKKHTQETSAEGYQGYYWSCACGSTLFVRPEQVINGSKHHPAQVNNG